LIYIGGNDRLQTPSAVGAAAATIYDYLNTRAPKVPIIVAGTYPSNATDTIGSQHASVNKAIRDATLQYSNIIGFIDPCGHATTGTAPSALVNGASYSVGQLFSYQGAIYEVLTAHTSGPSPHGYNTRLLSWLTGTGTASAPAGNGNRDTLLSSDGVHWTLDGAGFTAVKLAVEAEKILDGYLK
jgi:lysophospholipase L1-like esterase